MDECFILFIQKGQLEYDADFGKFKSITGVSGSCATNVTSKNEKGEEIVKEKIADIRFKISLINEEKPSLDNHKDLKEIDLSMKIKLDLYTQWWNVSEIVVYGQDKQVKLTGDYLHFPFSYSYSCGNLELHKLKDQEDKNDKNSFINLFKVISFNRFQIQPFLGDENESTFSKSYGCESWFTIGTLTGLFILILFTSILAFGIFYIINIKTNDRFEDPKGKPLNIGNTDN